jgi:hypothetical protein
MPIVFVHGVNNRDGEAYRENEAARDGFLREIVAPALGITPEALQIVSPYWGKYGVDFVWKLAVVPNPEDTFERFGADPESVARGRVAGLLAESGNSGDLLMDAKKDFAASVDVLYASAMAGARSEREARELAKSYVRIAQYADRNPKPAWVEKATSGNFVDQLNYAADASRDESFGADGILSSLKEALSRVANALPADASDVAGRLLRKKLNATVTRFAGDAFVYLNQRGTQDKPGPIVTEVLNGLHSARQRRAPGDDKLIVVAHSFGGEIIYDIVTYFDPDVSIDCLITVGSQVGLFEEMKLYVASRPNVPPDPPKGHVPRPAAVKRWLNVFDTNDILSYRLAPVVGDVRDFFYDTGFSSLSAHGGYFMRPSFYTRLAARLQERTGA